MGAISHSVPLHSPIMSVKDFASEARSYIQQQSRLHSDQDQRGRVLEQFTPPTSSAGTECAAAPALDDEQNKKNTSKIMQLAQKLGLPLAPEDVQVVQELWARVSLLRDAQGECRSDQEVVAIFIQQLQQLHSQDKSLSPPHAAVAANSTIANHATGDLSDDHMLDMPADSTMSDTQDPNDVAAKEILQKRNRFSFDSALSNKEIKRPKRNS